jgi:hypothetical protein
MFDFFGLGQPGHEPHQGNDNQEGLEEEGLEDWGA